VVADTTQFLRTGSKFPQIREHFQKHIGSVYREMDLGFTGFPAEDKRDPEACALSNPQRHLTQEPAR
jgi:D-galacturonate reductase